jgi:hypothetical protein
VKKIESVNLSLRLGDEKRVDELNFIVSLRMQTASLLYEEERTRVSPSLNIGEYAFSCRQLFHVMRSSEYLDVNNEHYTIHL